MAAKKLIDSALGAVSGSRRIAALSGGGTMIVIGIGVLAPSLYVDIMCSALLVLGGLGVIARG